MIVYVVLGANIEGQLDHSVIFRDVLINRDSQVKNAIIMQGARIGAGCKLENVIIDKDAVIGPNLVLKGTSTTPLVISKGQHVFQQAEVAVHD